MPEIIRHLGVKGKCPCMQGDDAQKAKIFEGLKVVNALLIELHSAVHVVKNNKDKTVEEQKQVGAEQFKKVADMLKSWNDSFKGKKYFLGEGVSLVDCYTVSTITFFSQKLFSQQFAEATIPDILQEIAAFYEDFIATENLIGKLEFAPQSLL